MSETQILLLCLLIIGVIAFIVKSIENHQDDIVTPVLRRMLTKETIYNLIIIFLLVAFIVGIGLLIISLIKELS
jgi:CDP-diglyceride synthetase